MPVSVVLPVHNGGDHLAIAVKSILAQKRIDLELLIIDDHSTDQAIQQLDTIIDERVELLRSPKRGIIPALNLGLEHAKFDLIARMDADDISLPHRLSKQCTFLEQNPSIQICATQVKLFNQGAIVGKGYQLYESWINSVTETSHIETEFFIESPLPHPSVMFYKKPIVRLGGYQDRGWPEDYDLWSRALLAGIKFGKVPEVLLHWRDGENRTSRTDSRYSKVNFIRCKAFYLARYLLNRKLRSIQIWGAGPTGRKMHDLLEHEGVQVSRFLDVNPKLAERTKRGKAIKIVEPNLSQRQFSQAAYLEIEKYGPIVVAVAARGAREDIRRELLSHQLIEGKQFIFAA